MIGIVSLSCLIAAESLVSTGVRRTQTSNINLVVGAALGQGNPDFCERAGGAATLSGGYCFAVNRRLGDVATT